MGQYLKMTALIVDGKTQTTYTLTFHSDLVLNTWKKYFLF
jgi:hypothetical protein